MQHFTPLALALLTVAGLAAPAQGRPDCPVAAHKPGDDVVHATPAGVTRADDGSGLAFDPRSVSFPIEVNILGGRTTPTGKPLDGKATVARVAHTKDGWIVQSATVPESAPMALERPCIGTVSTITIGKPAITPPRRDLLKGPPPASGGN